MTADIIPVEVKRSTAEIMQMAENVFEYRIRGNHEYGLAGGLLVNVKERAKEIDLTERSITKPINEGLKNILDFFREPKSRLKAAEKHLEMIRAEYRATIEGVRKEKEAAAQEIARKDRDKLERQAAALEERERKKRDEEELAAKALEDAGKEERAKAAREASAERARVSAERVAALRDIKASWPGAPVVHFEAPKTEGVYTVTRWKAVVVDKAALIRAVADGRVPDVLEVDMAKLNKLAAMLKDGLNYPGIRVESTESESVRV